MGSPKTILLSPGDRRERDSLAAFRVGLNPRLIAQHMTEADPGDATAEYFGIAPTRLKFWRKRNGQG